MKELEKIYSVFYLFGLLHKNYFQDFYLTNQILCIENNRSSCSSGTTARTNPTTAIIPRSPGIRFFSDTKLCLKEAKVRS